MSIHVISWVLEHSNATGNDRLALIVFADHASSDGTDTYPSADCIAYEGRMARSTAIDCRKRLQASGRIIHTGVDPWGKGIPNYRVRMDVEAEGPPPRPRYRKGGPKPDPAGVGITGGEGSETPGAGGPNAGPEPSLEPSTEPPHEPSRDMALAVFDEWRHLTGRTEGTKFTPKRRTAVEARLREQPVLYDDRLTEVRTAVAFVAGSKWHRENGHTELAVICRNPEQIEGYLQRHEAAKARSAPSSTMSQYDRAIQ